MKRVLFQAITIFLCLSALVSCKSGREDPDLRMGSLLTIPKDVTAESLGLETKVGHKIFCALQNYGCYVTDDSAWDCYCLCAEDGVRSEVKEKYGVSLNTRDPSDPYYRDMNKIVKNLYVVTNNSPDSIGGGGTPSMPLAPDFQK